MNTKKYKSWSEARKDGWLLVPCTFPTMFSYFSRNGQIVREDEIIDRFPGNSDPGAVSTPGNAGQDVT